MASDALSNVAGVGCRTAIDHDRTLFQAMTSWRDTATPQGGMNVPAPLTLQVSHDTPTISDQENADGWVMLR